MLIQEPLARSEHPLRRDPQFRSRTALHFFSADERAASRKRPTSLETRESNASIRLWLLIQCLALACSVATTERRPKEKPTTPYKSIKWNSTYYSQPFKPCKALKEFNPVERARAHGVAVDVFRRCGPSLIIPHATKYRFPAFGECFRVSTFLSDSH